MDCGNQLILYLNEEFISPQLLVDIFGTTNLEEIQRQKEGGIDEENLYHNSENSIN